MTEIRLPVIYSKGCNMLKGTAVSEQKRFKTDLKGPLILMTLVYPIQNFGGSTSRGEGLSWWVSRFSAMDERYWSTERGLGELLCPGLLAQPNPGVQVSLPPAFPEQRLRLRLKHRELPNGLFGFHVDKGPREFCRNWLIYLRLRP